MREVTKQLGEEKWRGYAEYGCPKCGKKESRIRRELPSVNAAKVWVFDTKKILEQKHVCARES